MFSNFFYLVIALIIYLSYQLPETPKSSAGVASLSFILLSSGFTLYCWLRFRVLVKKMHTMSPHHLDHKFSGILTHFSIIALILFTLNIYMLNLPSFFSSYKLFLWFPTLLAIFFVFSFIGYLSIVWLFAHNAYRQVYRIQVSRLSYVFSNISFAIPILFAWTIISGSIDIIHALPFDWPKRVLSEEWGQIAYSFLLILPLTLIAPELIHRFWRCSPLQEGAERERIEALLKRAKLRFNNILYWPIFSGRMITAGVMGLFYRFRYILVTKALFQILAPDEVDAVIAHEVGHVKKRHLLYYLFFVIGFIIFSLCTISILLSISYRFDITLQLSVLDSFFSNSSAGTILKVLFPIFMFLLYFRIIFGYFMRNFERQADCYIYTLFDDAKALISTFRKIVLATGQPYDKPNWHHFSIKERIDYLELCEADFSYVRRQDRKVAKSLIIYFFSLLIFIGAGIYAHNYNIEARYDVFFEIIHEKKSDNPKDYIGAGDLFTQKKAYQSAIDAYEYAIMLKPNSAYALNNLAWLYATCEDETFQNKEKALELALKAISIDPKAPDILDTYAESLYLNGEFQKAVEIQLKALELLSPKQSRSHFETQLKKFETALKR